MFRNALLRSAHSAASQAVRRSGAAIARPAAPSSFITSQFAPSLFQAVRCYSAAAGLQKGEVESRIIDLLNNFDKVCLVVGLMELQLTIPCRFPIRRRYDSDSKAHIVSVLIIGSFRRPHTSRTILVWTVWTLLRL
jgi:hypothetical protein